MPLGVSRAVDEYYCGLFEYCGTIVSNMDSCGERQIIDDEGFRLAVGIILTNRDGQVLWARRIGRRGWQFPQGGIRVDERPTDAMYRELGEEVGLAQTHVEVLGYTRAWLQYRLPKRFIRHGSNPLCIGQRQRWFMLRLIGDETHVRLDMADRPEFDQWRWVEYWYPLREVVGFKRSVYRRALREFAPLIFSTNTQQA